MKARYAGTCRMCGGHIGVGDEIARVNGRWAHRSCPRTHRHGIGNNEDLSAANAAGYSEARAEESSADRAEIYLARQERRAMDAEYAAGVADARAYQQNKAWFGEEMAEAMEFEAEFNRPEGW